MSAAIYFSLLFILFTSVQAEFPEDPKPCKYGDSQCIVNLINRLLSEKTEVGDSSINMDILDPLPIDKLTVKKGADSPININMTFTNNQLLGLKSTKAISVRGFGKDLTKKHEVRMSADVVSLVGPYTINGKVLILPISGQGASNLTFVKPELTMTWTGKAIEKDGESYMEPSNMKIECKPERVYYFYGNLFNGDKALGDNMNSFLNDNWEPIFQEVRPEMQVGFGELFRAIIAKVFSKYPYAKYFEE